MVFNINDFKSATSKLGFSRTAHYAVSINPPNFLNHPIVTDLPLLCDTANLPGAQFAADVVKHKGYGIGEKRPTALEFNDITLTIIGDAQGKVLNFIQEWVNFVYAHDEESEKSDDIETFNYPSDYWGTLELYLYDITSKKYLTYTMDKAYPIDLGAIQLGWESVDTLVRIPVTFTYRNYRRDAGFKGTAINNNADENRNVQKLEQLITNPNIPEYEQRLTV